MTELMVELREMKAQMLRSAEQIGRLEKRLRIMAAEQTA